MTTLGHCESCQKHAPLALAHFRKVTGILLVALTHSSSGMLCRSCARRRFISATIHNLTLGWWSVVSLFVLPIFLVTNTVELIRLWRGDDTPAAPQMPIANLEPEAFHRLPWANLLGTSPALANIGNRSITLPMAIAVIAAIGVFVGFIGVVALASGDGNNTPQEAAALRYWSKAILIISTLIVSVCIYWDHRKTHRPDTALDVLAKIVPLNVIFQCDRVHFTAFAFETDGRLRVVLAAQNLFNAPTSFRVNLAAANETYPLDVQLQPSEATAFFIHLPLNLARHGIAYTTFTASTTGNAGRRVRFQSRESLTTPNRAAFATIALALSGHFSVSLSDDTPGSLTFMNSHGNLSVAIPRDLEPCPTSATWRRIGLWSPDSPMPPEYAASVLVRLIEESSAASTHPSSNQGSPQKYPVLTIAALFCTQYP